MARKFNKIFFLGILLFLFFQIEAFSKSKNDKTEYARIISIFKARNESLYEKESYNFLKKYPKSRFVPHVRLMLADIESDTELAERKYRMVVKYYRYFPHRDYALLKICEILDLKSKWKELYRESAQAKRIFSKSRYINRFRFMNIAASIMLNKFETARKGCISISEKTHDPDVLSRSIFYLAQINRKKTGNSKSYIYNLRELTLGFKNSKIYPSILYKLAEFHREKKNKNMAYSAYSDLNKYFPDSPESSLAIIQMEKLKLKKPKMVNYIPNRKYVNSTSTIDIQPERSYNRNNSGIYYAISIGPFSKKYKVNAIKKLLRNYPEKEIVETNFGFTIYLGRCRNTDDALSLRIRMAEEHGINGTIVRISDNPRRSYIYKD